MNNYFELTIEESSQFFNADVSASDQRIEIIISDDGTSDNQNDGNDIGGDEE